VVAEGALQRDERRLSGALRPSHACPPARLIAESWAALVSVRSSGRLSSAQRAPLNRLAVADRSSRATGSPCTRGRLSETA
jgi:hypothetical protein